MTNAIIIEDNLQAEQALRGLLAEIAPQIKIIGSADRVVAGAKLVRVQQPELLFLDIELPDGTGFDLLDIVGEWTGSVIFTTGLDDQALRAFRYAAVDYLVKPIAAEQLIQAVQRASSMTDTSARQSQRQLLQQARTDVMPARLAIHGQESIHIVPIADIIYLQAESNYTTFFLASGKKIVVGKTLKTYAELLDEHTFLRVHQSYLINPEYLKEFVKTDGGYLLLKGGEKIPVSVRRRTLVMEYLQGLT